MTVLQTERFYPQIATGHPRLDALGRHIGTAALTTALGLTAISAALAAAGTIAATINPLTAGPLWQLMYAPVLGTATYRLARYTWALKRMIGKRI